VRKNWLVLALILLAACAGGNVPQPVIEAPVDDPVRSQLEWFAARLNEGSVAAEDYSARFVDEFQARVPFETAFLPVFAGMESGAGEWRLIGLDLAGSRGEGLLAAAGERMRVQIEVEPEPPHRIVDLLVQPVMISNPPTRYEEVVDPLRRYGQIGFLAADVTDGSCAGSLFESGADEVFPIAGASRLYVVAAVARAVAAGSLSWDSPVTIEDRLRSHPQGVLRLVEAGESRTVGELLFMSLARSDNGATDHLLETIGREEVERVLESSGNSAVARNLPFLATRQVAALKIGSERGRLAEYAGAPESARVEILESFEETGLGAIEIPSQPVEVDTVEWFASPGDLCELMVGLWDLAQLPGMEPLAAALTDEPGIAPQAGRWSRVWFAGGSEPGVLTLVWLTEGAGGDRVVTIGSIVNPTKAFPTIDATLLLAAGRDLAGAG
jgi:Beta-lactamase enzyme family